MTAVSPPATGQLSLAPLIVLASAALFCVLVLLAASSEARLVYAPLLAQILIGLGFVCALWQRDQRLPVFEVGTICVAATTLYSAVPLLNFIAGGLEWTIVSDPRIRPYAPTPAETGGFAWRHVLYLASLAWSYLLVRGSRTVKVSTLVQPPRE